MQFVEASWPLILIALALAALIAWYIFHAARRTRVTGERRDVLDEGAAPAARNQALIDAPTAAASGLPLHAATAPGPAEARDMVRAVPELAPASAATGADDLSRIKGVGPKLVIQLHALGVISFSQIAAWSEADIDRVDAQLGRFQGRIRRDGWVEQAGYLAKGDAAGFAARFGATN